MSKIIPFCFEDLPISVVLDEDGEPWFVAADVCAALDLLDVSGACEHLDEDERGTTTVSTLPGGDQNMLTINKSGLYSLTFHSPKPEANRFKRWVNAEVLPPIRRMSVHIAPSATLQSLPPAIVQELIDIVEQALSVELPQALQAQMARLQGSLRYSQTAAQIWTMHGLARCKGGPRLLSRCLAGLGYAIESSGRPGGRNPKRFDVEKSALAMRVFLLEHCKKHIAKRRDSVFTLKRI